MKGFSMLRCVNVWPKKQTSFFLSVAALFLLGTTAGAVTSGPVAARSSSGLGRYNFNFDNMAIIKADDIANTPPADSRYFFHLLDHRSKYATGFFPGGIVAAAMPAQREIAETWYHYQRSGLQDDLFYNEVKWGLDQWTLSFEAPWQHEHVDGTRPGASRNLDGFDNFAISFRSPVYQYVSSDGLWDYSLVPDFEVDAPSGSATSSGTVVYPQVYQLLGIGRHLSLQGSFGTAFLTGSKLGGQVEMKWSAIIGYNLYHKNLPIPGIADITPIMEIVGSDPISGTNVGQQSISMDFGAEINPMPRWGFLTPYFGIAAGPALTRLARVGDDWVVSAYVAFALP
ncbi:MAG: hypothetical protein HKL95_03890 [Phycisphaerae bacterium]|nr:hypothetical protein [Phycisphaerae bacterium]